MVGPNSGWFSPPNPTVERIHSVGKAEGEAARERLRAKERARQEKIIAANEKMAQGLSRRAERVRQSREALAASGKSTEPPEAGTKGSKSRDKSEALMKKVTVETRSARRIQRKNDGA